MPHLLHNGPSAAPAALDKASIASRHPRHGSYPPISTIPHMARQRLEQAAAEAGAPGGPGSSVLYLAYGSNMSAETFLGVRGIRPLSRVNVAVPTLRLTFDLPGLPYREPCFANVGFRAPGDDKAPLPPPEAHQVGHGWEGQLMGVVYEVTAEDWRTIMRTEGAGSSYKEIVVPCLPVGPAGAGPGPGGAGGEGEKWGVAQKPPGPILARTLHASSAPDDGDGGAPECRWWYRLSSGRRRPDPGYAQASARYLGLLRDGAREHGLPEAYQEYLASLQPYTKTHWRQTVGLVLLLAIWGPPLLFFLAMTGIAADKGGRLPPWLAAGMAGVFNLMWMSYDGWFKGLFGDGERTEDPDREGGEAWPLVREEAGEGGMRA